MGLDILKLSVWVLERRRADSADSRPKRTSAKMKRDKNELNVLLSKVDRSPYTVYI